MAESKKPEVNLEVCSGFFRIPTDNLVFNITVLDLPESSTTRVVEKIVEVEKEAPSTPTEPPAQPEEKNEAPAANEASQVSDDFYQKALENVTGDLSELAESLGDEIGGNQTPEGVEDLSEMANDLKSVLMNAKEIVESDSSGGSGGASSSTLKDLAEKLEQAQSMAGGSGEPVDGSGSAEEDEQVEEETPEAATTKMTRHLFDIDATFQTMYELCTNETVKTHIQNARGKAEELFAKDTFYDEISPKVSGYDEDDGFLNIPMSDIYQALAKACSDKATINLMKKMDKGQAEIFLDQFLPLEVPPTEEVEVAAEGGEAKEAPKKKPKAKKKEAAVPASDSELATLLGECKELLEIAIAGSGDDDAPANDGGDSTLSDAINDAITITGSIIYDATQLAESGSLDGGDGFESTLWYKIKKSSMLYSTMLSKKSVDGNLSFDDGLAAGNESVQSLKDDILKKIEAAKPEPEPDDDAGSGEASQDDIDKLLEEMGG